MGPRRRTLMNDDFEELLYTHFWTEKIQDQWAQLMKDNNYDHKHYIQAFAGCVFYTLGVFRQADTLGKVFSNGWSFNSVKESSLSKVKVHKCYRRLLKPDVVKIIFQDMPDMKPFLLWLVRNPSVVNYCGLYNEFPPDKSLESESCPSAETRFKKLLEYTEANISSLTLEEVLSFIKSRNYRGRKNQEDSMEDEIEDVQQILPRNDTNDNNNNNINVKMVNYIYINIINKKIF